MMPKRRTPPSVDPDTLNAILRDDLGTFIAKVFQTVSPGSTYLDNWHVDAIVYQLLRIQRGDNRWLIINQPPRSLKSLCVSVAYVAWALGHDPTKRFACVSYSAELAATFARQFRLVVNSTWYQALFPKFRLAKDTETECETTLGGGRYAIAVGGSFTGRGADVIIIDDPLKASDAQSKSAREEVNRWFGSTALSRLDDKQRGAIIIVAQRLHEDDLSGKLLAEGEWYHLNLPAIADDDVDIPTGPAAAHHRRKGDLLHMERESEAVLEDIKLKMGSLAFAAQYQQSPIPTEGNIVRRTWIQSYDEVPERRPGVQLVQSWDLASTVAETRDWSVCTTWLIDGRQYYLIDVWRGRLTYPDLKKKLIALAQQHDPNRILIEQAGPGLHMLQDLRADPPPRLSRPIGIRPEGDKLMRMEAQSARFEAGQIFFPKEAPWLSDLMHELLAFPNTRYDDQIDSVSQFLNWAETAHFRLPRVSLVAPIIVYG